MIDYDEIIEKYSSIIDRESLTSVILAIHKLYSRRASFETHSFEATIEELSVESGVDTKTLLLSLSILVAENVLEVNAFEVESVNCLSLIGSVLGMLDYMNASGKVGERMYTDLVYSLMKISGALRERPARGKADEAGVPRRVLYMSFYRAYTLLQSIIGEACSKILKAERFDKDEEVRRLLQSLLVKEISALFERALQTPVGPGKYRLGDVDVQVWDGLPGIPSHMKNELPKLLEAVKKVLSSSDINALKKSCGEIASKAEVT